MSDEPRPGTKRVSPVGRRRQAGGWLLALAGVSVLTSLLVGVGTREEATPTYQPLLYLVVVVVCALVGGRWPAFGASGLSFLALNYYFTAPFHTLNVTSRLGVLSLVTFLVITAAVSAVVDSAARRGMQAARAAAEAEVLARLNERVLAGRDDVADLLLLARDTFGAESATLVSDEVSDFSDAVVAPVSAHTHLVLRGVELTPSDRRVLSAFATHLGVLREREELARQSAAAHELEIGNRTRTALIAAVSHDLRTPLAGIRSAAETLQRRGTLLSPEDQGALLEVVSAGADRLGAIIADLLDMSRLQTGAVAPHMDTIPAGAVVETVLQGLAERERVSVASSMPTVRGDAGLLERVLENVVANALVHTDGAVEVTGQAIGQVSQIIVRDHGPGVAPDLVPAMFEPFQRMGDQSDREGIGLGLAVARGLLEAQGGRLSARETPGGGLTMVLELGSA